MGSVIWTSWASVQSLSVESLVPDFDFINKKITDFNKETVVLKEGFKNSFAFLVGLNYHFSEKFTYKFGLGYYMSPSATNQGRNLQLPDASRYMASIGLKYKPYSDIHFDMGYMFVYTKSKALDYTAPPGVQGALTSCRQSCFWDC